MREKSTSLMNWTRLIHVQIGSVNLQYAQNWFQAPCQIALGIFAWNLFNVCCSYRNHVIQFIVYWRMVPMSWCASTCSYSIFRYSCLLKAEPNVLMEWVLWRRCPLNCLCRHCFNVSRKLNSELYFVMLSHQLDLKEHSFQLDLSFECAN